FFLPLMGLLCLLMPLGPVSNWKRTTVHHFFKLLWRPWVAATMIALTFPAVYREKYEVLAAVTVFVSSWIAISLIADIWHRLRNSASKFQGFRKLTLGYYAMIVAHAGIAVTITGVGLT